MIWFIQLSPFFTCVYLNLYNFTHVGVCIHYHFEDTEQSITAESLLLPFCGHTITLSLLHTAPLP